jgi:hypothetical protein
MQFDDSGIEMGGNFATHLNKGKPNISAAIKALPVEALTCAWQKAGAGINCGKWRHCATKPGFFGLGAGDICPTGAFGFIAGRNMSRVRRSLRLAPDDCHSNRCRDGRAAGGRCVRSNCWWPKSAWQYSSHRKMDRSSAPSVR